MDQLNLKNYSEARKYLKTGMLALCRSRSIEGDLIAEVTDSPYTHVGMLGKAGTAFMLGETLEHKDARLVCLREQVRSWPNCWDIYQIRPDKYPRYCPEAAWGFICHASGARYGWRYCTRVWLRKRLGEWIPPLPNSNDPQTPRNCSGLVHAASRICGGPKLKQYDSDVVPGDWSDPRYTEYVMTLTWNPLLDARCT